MDNGEAPPVDSPTRSPDAESAAWVSHLTGTGKIRDDAIDRLHLLMTRVARAESSRRSGWNGIQGQELTDLADQAADDAVISILRKVGDFRGESRFTTWACAFAIHEVSEKFGRHVWRRDGVQLDESEWDRLPAGFGGGPEAVTDSRAMVVALREAVEGTLTERQRRIFTAIVVNHTPLDVLAAELGTNRNAIYKTMFDARRKLKAHLVSTGYLDSGKGVSR